MGKLCTKGIYASGMVLQRNTTNCIFGSAEAFSTVTMNFRGETYSSKTDSNGNWKIEYNPGKEGGPFDLSLSSNDEKINFSDVYIGEVWVSSGQSNAQLPMQRMYFSYKEEFALPVNNNIRIITIPISYSFDGEKDSVTNPTWLNASPENMGLLSGTSYFFAKKLSEELKMPVGIINASQGGSPIAAWMNEDSLKSVDDKLCLEKLKECKNPEYIQSTKDEIKAKQDKWFDDIFKADKGTSKGWEKLSFEQISSENSDWKDCTIPNDFALSGKAAIVWFKKEIELSEEQINQFNSKKTWLWFGTIQDADAIYVNGTQIGATYYTYPPRRYIVPANTLKTGKNTITVRCQKNGTGDLRFYTEKKYCLFTEDVSVHPTAVRNMEVPENDSADCNGTDGIKITISGKWKMKVACEMECHPGEVFFEWKPTALFNSMLAPSFNYAVAGALWYQGESDSERADTYKTHLTTMIDLWRKKYIYAPENMPFVVMQLPNWSDGRHLDNVYSDWSLMREAQREAVNGVKNAAYAVCVDAGEWNDLHPEKKRTSGTRAAIQALRIAYNKKFESPVEMVKAEKKDNCYILQFSGEKPLKAFEVCNQCADFNTESNMVYGFEFLTSEKKLLKADAELISKNEVKVSIPETSDELKELRFLWANSPDIVNLYSDSLIPVSTFRINI